MAQAAHVHKSPGVGPSERQDFVQLKDGSFAWENSVTGDLTPARRQPEWDSLFALLEEFGPAPPEFMEGLDDPLIEDEEIF